MLVGGEGTRLRPLTATTPKSLLPIANQPFLERQLAWLASAGIDEVVLALGYLADPFVARFPDRRFGALRLHYAVEDRPLGTAGAVRAAANVVGIREPFVVCNGDVLTTIDVGELVSWHAAHGAQATIALTAVADPSAFGVVRHTPDGMVHAFIEKPGPGHPAGDREWVNTGTYVLEPGVLDRIPSGRMVSIERETFPGMLEESGQLWAAETDAYWIDIGTVTKYLEANADVLGGCLGPVPAPGAREVAPRFWVQGDADVASDATIIPPVLLGAGAGVGAAATVAASVLGGAARVDVGAVAERTVLHDGARLDPGARVADSIVGAGAVVGAGASVTDGSVIGAGEAVSTGAVLVGGRIPADRPS